jgi:hypothetical protein
MPVRRAASKETTFNVKNDNKKEIKCVSDSWHSEIQMQTIWVDGLLIFESAENRVSWLIFRRQKVANRDYLIT